MQLNDIVKIVDYFHHSSTAFLKGMGANKNKLPKREEWINQLKLQLAKPYAEKEFYYIIWLIDKDPVGHCNVNQITFGKMATMHLHLWKNDTRKKGLGSAFLKQTIPFFFKNLQLEKLICEPYSKNRV